VTLQVFKSGFKAEESPTLRLQTLQTVAPIFSGAHPLIATPFIHCLGPLVISYLKVIS
jgi:hypothetical protein